MIPQEIQKAMQFLLEQGAAADARQQETQVHINELVEQNKALSGRMDELTGETGRLWNEMNNRDRRLSARIDKLVDACRSLVDHARLTDARLARLEQSET